MHFSENTPTRADQTELKTDSVYLLRFGMEGTILFQQSISFLEMSSVMKRILDLDCGDIEIHREFTWVSYSNA
ncbi:MAG: hypothetical protein ACLQBD_27830 [Syntrophobacteraceae bacterium]